MPRRLRQFASAKLAGEAFSIPLVCFADSFRDGSVAALFLFFDLVVRSVVKGYKIS